MQFIFPILFFVISNFDYFKKYIFISLNFLCIFLFHSMRNFAFLFASILQKVIYIYSIKLRLAIEQFNYHFIDD